MANFSPFRPIATLFYAVILRIKLSWYSRQKRKRKKVVRAYLSENLEKQNIDEKTIEIIIVNYLKIGELFLDRKILKAAFSIDRFLQPKKIKNKN